MSPPTNSGAFFPGMEMGETPIVSDMTPTECSHSAGRVLGLQWRHSQACRDGWQL